MKMNKRYLNDLLVRMAHHSTAIEGNTLTQAETASILVDNFIPKSMNEREYYEVKNFKKAFDFMENNLSNQEKISIKFIKEMHNIVMQNLLDNAGKFKKIENMIVGATFETTKPYLVQIQLKEMCDNLEYRLINSISLEDKIETIVSEHLKFEKIHPFSDGNGRIGRLLMMYSCLSENIVPFVITKEEKKKYINIMRKEDVNEFIKWSIQLINLEKERKRKFEMEDNELIKNSTSKEKSIENLINKLSNLDFSEIPEFIELLKDKFTTEEINELLEFAQVDYEIADTKEKIR